MTKSRDRKQLEADAHKRQLAQAQTLINAVSEHFELDATKLSIEEFERLAAELLASPDGKRFLNPDGKLRASY